jgi:drug/metabolite transporter (DMT)-like permease
MITGIILALLTACAWTGVAVLFTRVGKRSIPVMLFYSMNQLIGSVMALGLINWPVLLSATVPRLWDLVLIMSVTGLINSISMLCLIQAMKLGHSALSWTIIQTAMVVQFLFATFYYHETAGILQFVGLGIIILTLFLSSKQSGNQPEEGKPKVDNKKWLLYVLLGFVTVGLGQSLVLIPSHWPGWTDSANLRPFITMFVSVPIMFLISIPVMKQKFSRELIILATVISVFGVMGLFFLYKCLDVMTSAGLSGIAYPVIIGTNIVLVSLYSRFILKEEFKLIHWVSIFTGIIGIILLSIKQ